MLSPERALLWVDRQGTATPVTKIKRPFSGPALSPDGKRVALTVQAERMTSGSSTSSATA